MKIKRIFGLFHTVEASAAGRKWQQFRARADGVPGANAAGSAPYGGRRPAQVASALQADGVGDGAERQVGFTQETAGLFEAGFPQEVCE
jgi:hypothetical protein